MTRTTNTAPRTNPLSTVLSSRSRKSAGTDSGDVKHRKGQTSAVNPKKDLDVDFSFKGPTVARVDEVKGEVEEASESGGLGHPAQVQLVDLLVPTRKSQKGKDGDFEVVPHIRPVIVLEDNVTPDLDPDEPWEHVFVVDDHPVNALSYAKVASLN